ncbi:ABC transporter permease [Microbacterium rhizosphaerae]|uniref:ABC transporter permease n=1 Tax=Microbacterium rhizosphaerae TaxID=1678237 RepID=A0ABZ0STQ5_9MICO|nr:ABC transporter permease [Microbacterium rhizosphaerae]WPR90766.1 ABC transporter permease [Microbacterium rhizosphaerae]
MSDTTSDPKAEPGGAPEADRAVQAAPGAATTTATTVDTAAGTAQTIAPPPRQNLIIRDIMRGSVVTTILAIVLAMLVGGILIALTDPAVQKAAGYFFARPIDTFAAIWNAVWGAYSALFQGSIINFQATSFQQAILPLTSTLGFAAPLTAAALGVALAFRVGLFNIGAQGQMLIACAASALLTFNLGLPMILQLPITLIVGIIGGALWGGIVGVLKARTGAHEVILTIMLNYIAFYLVSWMVRTPSMLQKPGTNQPISSPTPQNAVFPALFGPQYPQLTWAFPVVLVATLFVWWLIERSSLGFRMRAVGENPSAARAAGISVPRMFVYAMLFAGGLAGLAGMIQIQSTITSGFDAGIHAGIGFDAITVALLGRSRAWGTLFAGILFGALKAGSFTMQALQGIPVDIVLVVQSLIVLFIAAPPLIRAIFFLPKTEAEKTANAVRKSTKKAARKEAAA